MSLSFARVLRLTPVIATLLISALVIPGFTGTATADVVMPTEANTGPTAPITRTMSAASVSVGGSYSQVQVDGQINIYTANGAAVSFTDCVINGSIVTYTPIHLTRCDVRGGIYAYDVGGSIRDSYINGNGQAFRPGVREGGGWPRRTPWTVENTLLRIPPGVSPAHVEAAQVMGGDGYVFRNVVFDTGCPFNNTQTADLSLNAANTLVEDSWFIGCGGFAIYSDGPNVNIVRPRFGNKHPWGILYQGPGRIDPVITDPIYLDGSTTTTTSPSTTTTTAPAPVEPPAGGDSVVVSSLPYTVVENGWGPVEKDRSNGEQAAGDGRVLSIRGTTYATGLGVHAASAVSVSLGGGFSQFAATVGVDDETAGGGSVVFEVYGDGVLLGSSGRLTGSSPAAPMVVDVTGRQELRLVVTDAGDGIDADHGDWANAVLTEAPQVTTRYVSELPFEVVRNGWGPVEKDMSNGEKRAGDGRTMSIRDAIFRKGLGVHAASEVKVAVPAGCTTFSSVVGVDDEARGRGTVVFRVYAGSELLASAGATGSTAAQTLRVDVTNVTELRLVVTDGGDNINSDHADWADAAFTCS